MTQNRRRSAFPSRDRRIRLAGEIRVIRSIRGQKLFTRSFGEPRIARMGTDEEKHARGANRFISDD